MLHSKVNPRFGVLVAMIILAAFSRCVPHMLNFSPLGAIGLFGAAYFSKRWQAFLIPIAATWLSDLFINNVIYTKYSWHFVWIYSGYYWIYGSYLLITLAGIFILKKVTVQRVLIGSLTSTAIFFLITNFACWPNNPLYEQNFKGLMDCYIAGLAYLKGTFLGDLFYSVVLFGSFVLLQKRFPVLKYGHV